MNKWNKPSVALPDEHRKILWLDSNGEETRGTFHDGRWFMGPELTMYIYYQPVFWRYDEER